MEKYKRVLVFSHNAFSATQNNGKTLEAFFSNWPKNSLAQLYLQPESPDFNFCEKYFRITDYDVINNIIIGRPPGQIINNQNSEADLIATLSPIVKKLYSDRRDGTERKSFNRHIHKAFVNRIPFFVLLRDLIWARANWKTNSLRKWLMEFAPDVLFFQGSSALFGYEIALWICHELQIPLVLQLTDDYTSNLYPWSLIEKFNKSKYKQIFSKAISISSRVIVISHYMADEYKKIYDGRYNILMNSVEQKISIKEKALTDDIKLVYAGNIFINRWKILKKIGIALTKLNLENKFQCRLMIYTPTLISKELESDLLAAGSITYGGTLNQEELALAIQDATILVHVEAFDTRMKKITKLSISTKIPEYMASRRCIFAVGPNDVASIRYLSENNLGQVATTDDIEVIKQKLGEILTNFKLRNQFSATSYTAFLHNHQLTKTQQSISEIIQDAEFSDSSRK